MRLQITKRFAPFCYPNMSVRQPQHGPQTWPWWRLLSVKAYRTNGHIPFEQAPAYCYNLWAYTRWGALVWHVGIDCRTPKQRGHN